MIFNYKFFFNLFCLEIIYEDESVKFESNYIDNFQIGLAMQH
jgi:hypothetical protein